MSLIVSSFPSRANARTAYSREAYHVGLRCRTAKCCRQGERDADTSLASELRVGLGVFRTSSALRAYVPRQMTPRRFDLLGSSENSGCDAAGDPFHRLVDRVARRVAVARRRLDVGGAELLADCWEALARRQSPGHKSVTQITSRRLPNRWFSYCSPRHLGNSQCYSVGGGLQRIVCQMGVSGGCVDPPTNPIVQSRRSRFITVFIHSLELA